MTNNDILRRIRFALDYTDGQMVAAFAKGGATVTEKEVVANMAKEGEPNAVECSDTLLGQFLDGLILEKRGPRKEGSPAPKPDGDLTNNAIFKKLRIALSMQEKDVLATLAAGGQKLSKGELTALFRNPGHKHFRTCGDQILRNFLNGMTRIRRSPKTGHTPAPPREKKKPAAPVKSPWTKK